MTWEDLRPSLLSSVLIVLLAALGVAMVQFLQRRVARLIEAIPQLREGRRKQLLTLADALRWIVDVLIVGSAALMLLSTAGVDVTPLLASVGVAGLALSLGAQTLIKDIIGGLFILGENQYAVGDTIKVGEICGSVERITLRSTHVRDLEGALHIVPNGEVRVVSNLTREWSRALVDVGVAYEETLDHTLHVFETLAADFAQDPEFVPHLMEPPQVIGPINLGDSAVTVRLMVKTQPGKQWEVSRALQRRILAVCDQEGIELPYPRQEVVLRNLQPDEPGSEEPRRSSGQGGQDR
jgi:small conductance mechanosensitive channel